VAEHSWAIALLVVASGAGTYVWRGIGVWVAGRINVESDWFRLLTCIAYAMIAGLIARVVVMPVGELAHSALAHRLLGVAIAVIAFRVTRRNQLVGVLLGSAALPLLGLLD
jgi:branched-subunit amino acid transport protein